jgi:hypothetical protein
VDTTTRTRLSAPTATAGVATATARPLECWNGASFAGPDSTLTLDHTLVAARNVVRSTADLPLQGAGIYTPGFPVTRTASRIIQNIPDQCLGC